MDLLYIPIIALINLGFVYLWNLKMRMRAFKSKQVWAWSAFGSLFNTWGLDVVQRSFGIDSILHMIQLSAGCWLVFAAASNAKYLVIYGWSKREFWLDCAGDLASFILAGILIYVAT